MSHLPFLLLALAVAAVVILAWTRVHRQHVEALAARAAEEARRAGKAPEPERIGIAAPPAPVPAVPAEEGSPPRPLRTPRPLYWPAFLALGLAWIAWGAVSSLIILYAGLGMFVVALTLWIREMLDAE